MPRERKFTTTDKTHTQSNKTKISTRHDDKEGTPVLPLTVDVRIKEILLISFNQF